jgi:primase-like protein
VVERALRHRWLYRPDARTRIVRPHDRKPVKDKQLRDLMAAIPNDDATDWEEWNRIGMALFDATDGSDFGFELFDEWSQKHYKYDDVTTAEKWEKFRSSPPQVISVGTLFYEADRAQFRAEVEAWEKVSRRELETSPW